MSTLNQLCTCGHYARDHARGSVALHMYQCCHLELDCDCREFVSVVDRDLATLRAAVREYVAAVDAVMAGVGGYGSMDAPLTKLRELSR